MNDSIEDHGVQAPDIDIKQGLTDLSSSKIAKVDDFAEYADAEAENGAVKDISPSIRNDEELVQPSQTYFSQDDTENVVIGERKDLNNL